MQMSECVVCLCLMISFQAVKSAPRHVAPTRRGARHAEGCMLKLNGKKITQSKLPATRNPDTSPRQVGGFLDAAGCGDPGRKLLNERRSLR